MTLQAKKGTLTVPLGTGQQSYSGLGFQPKVILFWISEAIGEGIFASARFGYGWARGGLDTDQRGVSFAADDNVSPTNCGRQHLPDAVVLVNGNSSAVTIATLVSLDADGFTLDWLITLGGRIVHFLALGGADIAQTAVGDFASPAAVGNQDVIVGFQPDVVLFLGASLTALGFGVDAAKLSIGAMTDQNATTFDTQRWAVAQTARDGQTMTANVDAMHMADSNSLCLLGLTTAGPVVDFQADFVAMLANGFRINWLDLPTTSGLLFSYLAIAGGRWGVDAGPVQIGQSQVDIITIIEPKGILFATVNLESAGPSPNLRGYLGGASRIGGPGSNRGVAGTLVRDATVPTQADVVSKTTKTLLWLAPGTPPTIDLEADADLFFTNGYRMTFSPAAPDSRQWYHVVAASVPDTTLQAALTGTSTLTAVLTVPPLPPSPAPAAPPEPWDAMRTLIPYPRRPKRPPVLFEAVAQEG